MERTITIKGTGKATIKPNFVIISLTVEVKEKKYANAVESAANKIKSINEALEKAGLEPGSAKTTSYNVRATYNWVKDRKNQMQSLFDGYACVHRLKIEFDYDMDRLGKVLATISASVADPKLDIAFTVKDKEAATEELLRNIAQSARKKAEILCSASGATLGKLITIDYHWGDNSGYPRAVVPMNNTCAVAMDTATLPSVEIQPKDIEVSDSATFVWEIQ